jgi:hypothetical protein
MCRIPETARRETTATIERPLAWFDIGVTMVVTRGGTDTAKAVARRAPSKAKKHKTAAYRFPKCARHPRGGVMCAACAMAGFTREEYEAYARSNPRRALPRPLERKRAPPKF